MKKEERYIQFSLTREMMETPDIIRNFKLDNGQKVTEAIKQTKRVYFTGEGSSRIFPAKNAIYNSRKSGSNIEMFCSGAREGAEFKLSDYVAFGASNSGSTREVIELFDNLRKQGHQNLYALTARENTKLAERSQQTFVLSCGWEQAVAATKSVAEQGLFYQELLAQTAGKTITSELSTAADAVEAALGTEIPADIIKAISQAGTIHFAGRNDGVAEELTLKTNEITRRKSDFLEGTYAVHGIEEVMNPADVVIVIDPFPAEQDKLQETLVQGVGLQVIAISTKQTQFPTILIPEAGSLQNYVYLAAGWNILVEVGMALKVNLDKAERARKVGNEYTPNA